jgi:PEP-CTERM motif
MYKKLAIAAACLSLFGGANAAAVVTGAINERLDANNVRIGSTVDYWYITVNAPGAVTIDVLSWEADSEGRVTNDGVGEAVDVNGDNRIAFIDAEMHLFAVDGALDVGDLIASNDDDFTNTYGDGSIFAFDSYLSLNLAAGNYVLAISGFSFSASDAVAGANSASFYPATCTANVAECDFAPTPSGDYQITFTGDVNVRGATQVPEPAPLALLGAALAAMALRRRRAA